MGFDASHSQMRISDADRQRVVELLQSCAGDGRITLDEFTERADAAHAAKTFAELAPLTQDLPTPADLFGDKPQAAEVVTVDDVVEFSPRTASVSRQGRWLVPRKILIRPQTSSVRLDFRKAELVNREVHIEIEAHMSSIQLRLPRYSWADDQVTLTMSSLRNRAARTGDETGVSFQVSGKLTMSSLSIRRARRMLW